DPSADARRLLDREAERVLEELKASRLEPDGNAGRIERGLPCPGLGELRAERKVDAREPVGADRVRLAGRGCDHAACALAGGALLEAEAGRAAVDDPARLRRVRHTHPGVEAHVTVLARRGRSAGRALGVRPRLPLGVGVAEALEVLAAITHAERVGAEEADV